jgi:hypothetical protein
MIKATRKLQAYGRCYNSALSSRVEIIIQIHKIAPKEEENHAY